MIRFAHGGLIRSIPLAVIVLRQPLTRVRGAHMHRETMLRTSMVLIIAKNELRALFRATRGHIGPNFGSPHPPGDTVMASDAMLATSLTVRPDSVALHLGLGAVVAAVFQPRRGLGELAMLTIRRLSAWIHTDAVRARSLTLRRRGLFLRIGPDRVNKTFTSATRMDHGGTST